MIGPPLRKLSTKKFLSNALSGIAGLAAGDALAAAVGEALAIVVAGGMPGAGESPGTAGLVAVAGALGSAPAGLAGDVPGGGGGGWPKEVNTSVTEQRLAISSVFIELIGKFFSRLEFR
jgi:hypothetical protein